VKPGPILIGGRDRLRLIGASLSWSKVILYSSYRVWNWQTSSLSAAFAPDVLLKSSWVCINSYHWISRCRCRAGVTVCALDARIRDDSNSLHRLFIWQITASIDDSLFICLTNGSFGLFWIRRGAFWGRLADAMLSLNTCWYFSTNSVNPVSR